MILVTYQSMQVLTILRKGEVYRANPSLSFKGEYAALIDMLGLECQCPVFAVVKDRKHNTSGRVSASIRLTLNVPDEFIKYTEYGVWADFMYAFRFSKPHDYTRLKPDCEEMTHRKYTAIIHNLKTPRPLGKYKYPQAILEEIKPEWVVGYKIMPPQKKTAFIAERLGNLFRK